MDYPREIQENIDFRLKILTKAKNNKELQILLIEECKNDPCFFISVFGWTYDPRLNDSHLPFILYDYQEKDVKETIECIENDKDMFKDKSRDMGMSWECVGIQAWGFLFKRWSQLYGSYDQDHVDHKGDMDAHFQRLEYFFNRLPKWMKPDDLLIKFMVVSSQKLGCDISGDCGENFGTGGRRKVVWLDEFSYWANDSNAFRKTRDTANSRMFFGTPNGRFNIFGKVMTNHKDYLHLDAIKKSLHWTLHPKKAKDCYYIEAGQKVFCTKEKANELWHLGFEVSSPWHETEKKKRTKLDMAKEIDLNYDDSMSNAVYPHFLQDATLGKYEYNPELKLYTGWDFGRDMVAIIWWQKDFKTDTIYIVDSFQKSLTKIDFFAAFITGEVTQGYFYSEEELEIVNRHKTWKHNYANHFGDPYNSDSKSVVTESTISLELQQFGIYLTTKRSGLEERIKKAELAMRRMYINDKLNDFIQSIIQSRYPQIKENNQNISEKTKPIHDINSHYRTALEYAIDNEPPCMQEVDKAEDALASLLN